MERNTKKILADYIEGNTNPELCKQVKKYIISNRNNDILNDALAEEWEATSGENKFHLNKEEYWIDIKKHITDKESTKEVFSKHYFSISIAAGIAIAVLFFLFHYTLQNEGTKPHIAAKITYIIKETKKGEKLNVSLPDGSNIRLNSSSKLQIPSDYGSSDDRMVKLEGEAFFNVSKFEGKSFKVISQGVTTKVLGTTFNINSKPKESEVVVAVVTGKVQVTTKRAQIILNPKELTQVSSESINLKKSNYDLDATIGWSGDLLVFKEDSFEDVIKDLEEWYGVEFVVEKQPQINEKYSGKFENSSLQLVLEGLGFSSSFDYEIKGKTVFLKF